MSHLDWALLPPNVKVVWWDGDHWRASETHPRWDAENSRWTAQEYGEVLSRPLPPVVINHAPARRPKENIYVR